MSEVTLREIIRSLLASHPNVRVSPVGHGAHAEIYVTGIGVPIGFEPERVKLQNLFVRADSVTASGLVDIDQRHYDHARFAVSKPNHNLFREPAFKDADLICFKVRSAWEAVRVIAEVAGIGLRK